MMMRPSISIIPLHNEIRLPGRWSLIEIIISDPNGVGNSFGSGIILNACHISLTVGEIDIIPSVVKTIHFTAVMFEKIIHIVGWIVVRDLVRNRRTDVTGTKN
jgi:hypothetical protein